MIALFINGILKIKKGFYDEELESSKKVWHVIYGIFCILFSICVLGFIFIQPHVSIQIYNGLLAFPMQMVGFAAIFKGFLVRAYAYFLRLINVALGIVTVSFSLNVLMNPEVGNIWYLLLLISILLLNILFRSALYLSEFGLSIKNLNNMKIVFMIVNGYYLKLEQYSDVPEREYISE
jgi:hypothetical protein